MQNDFCSKGGLFDRAGINISVVREAVGPTRLVLSTARMAGMKVVYLKMGFRFDLSDLGDTDSPNRERLLHFGVGEPCTASARTVLGSRNMEHGCDRGASASARGHRTLQT